MDTVQYLWKRDRFPRILKNSRLFIEIVAMKNEEGRPYSFEQVTVQKIREIYTKGVQS